MKSPFMVWKLIVLILFMGLAGGCSKSSEVGVQFNNEKQLVQEGFVININQEVTIGDEKVVFEKIAFDRNSIAFAYKGGTVPLASAEFIIKGHERTKSQNLTKIDTSPSFGTTAGNGFHVTVVPHNLKLVDQKVNVEFNIDERQSKFTFDFPGDKINSSTTEVFVASNGNIVEDISKATYRVMVGVGYTIMESKDNSDFTLETQDKQNIKRSSKGSTTGESLAVYEPLPFPRSHPTVIVDPIKQVVVMSKAAM